MINAQILYEEDRREWYSLALYRFPLVPWKEICAKHRKTEEFYRQQSAFLNAIRGDIEEDDFGPVPVPLIDGTAEQYYDQHFNDGMLAFDGERTWVQFSIAKMFKRINALAPVGDGLDF